MEPSPGAGHTQGAAEPLGPSATVVAANEPAEPAPTGSLDAAAIRRVWDEVLTAVRRRSVKDWAVAREATVREVEGNTLVLLFRHQVHATMLSNNPKALVDAVTELLGGRWNVRCEVAGAEPPAQAQPPPVAPVQRPPQQSRVQAEEDWPAAAVPGGGQAGLAGNSGAGGVRTATAVAPAPPLAAPARAVAPATPAAAIAPVAPAAASAAAARPASAPRPAPERPTWDEEPPPYETEYGFDPGDEPIDDEAPAVRESSEEQALRLLREHLGAERID